ncbi:MAG: DUF5667 domain-containing protein [Candidatus Paceibacterota bacterium]|jgi:hypothetical protein
MKITDKQLIEKLEQLDCIKPDTDWVLLAEQKILASQPVKQPLTWFSLNFISKPAFSLALSAFAFVSIAGGASFTLAQGALPGDLLYPLKKVSQNVRMAFVPEQEQPAARLELAKSNLEDLSRITQQEKNQGQKLAASIAEAQKTFAAASKSLKQSSAADKQATAQQIVGQLESLKIQQKAIEQNIKTDIINDVQKSDLAESTVAYYKLYLDNQIEQLDNSSLTEAQAVLLLDAKNALAEGDVEKALNIVVNEIPNQNKNATSTEKIEEETNQTTTETSNK